MILAASPELSELATALGLLDASGNLASFEHPVIPLLVMAAAAVAVLITVHMLWLNVGATPSAPRVR